MPTGCKRLVAPPDVSPPGCAWERRHWPLATLAEWSVGRPLRGRVVSGQPAGGRTREPTGPFEELTERPPHPAFGHPLPVGAREPIPRPPRTATRREAVVALAPTGRG